jgi:hypothetical protein
MSDEPPLMWPTGLQAPPLPPLRHPGPGWATRWTTWVLRLEEAQAQACADLLNEAFALGRLICLPSQTGAWVTVRLLSQAYLAPPRRRQAWRIVGVEVEVLR